MKIQLFIISLLLCTSLMAQSFTGSGDHKVQIGTNFQDNATGIVATYDVGLGDNISVGLLTTYALGIDDKIDADFDDRFDVRGRVNANIGNVLNIDENFDLYPGLSLGLRNFGGHVGARFFFTEGFGLFSEIGFPIAKYNTDDLTPAEEINNQFQFNAGLVFNLN